MKNLSKAIQQINKSYIFFASLLFSLLIAGCACTKGYVFDYEKSTKRGVATDFDSAYYIIGELFQESFGNKRQILKVHGTNYAGLEQGQRFTQPLDLSTSVLYWADIRDSLHFIKSEGKNRWYAIEGVAGTERKELNMIVYFGQKAIPSDTTVKMRHYILNKFTNCRFGLH